MNVKSDQAILSLWGEYYSNRYQWIDGAVTKYIASIPEGPLQEIVKGSFGERVAVGLYGLTQVGKTTFVLDLLGIKEEFKAELNEVLRCGSRAGNSATPTAMIYRQGTDPEFVYREGSTTKRLTIEGLRDELIQLRERVEAGALEDLTEVMIDIPSTWFDDKSGRVNIQIIDLPGVGSKNDAEIGHVNRILSKYLPVVSLVFVFTKIDKISGVFDLFNNGMMNEYLGWKYLGSRYRLVTTYSFSDDSTRQLITDGKLFAVDQIKDYIRERAETDQKRLPDDVKVYPMEMGGSLHGLMTEWRPYYDVISKIIAEVKEQIIADINASANKTAQFKSAAKVGGAILRLRDDHVQERQNAQQVLNGEINELNTRIQQSCILIQEIENEISDLFARVDRCGTNGIPKIDNYCAGRNRDIMLGHLVELKTTVINWLNDIWNSFNGNGTPTVIGSDDYKIAVENQLSGIRNELNTIIFNKGGFFGIIGPEQKHVNSVNHSTERIRNLCWEWFGQINNERQRIKEDYEKGEVGQLRNKIWQQGDNIRENTERINQCHRKISSIESEIEEIKVKYQREYDRIGGFNHYLTGEFKSFFETQRHLITEKSGLDSLMQLFYCKTVIDTLNEIELANN